MNAVAVRPGVCVLWSEGDVDFVAMGVVEGGYAEDTHVDEMAGRRGAGGGRFGVLGRGVGAGSGNGCRCRGGGGRCAAEARGAGVCDGGEDGRVELAGAAGFGGSERGDGAADAAGEGRGGGRGGEVGRDQECVERADATEGGGAVEG